MKERLRLLLFLQVTLLTLAYSFGKDSEISILSDPILFGEKVILFVNKSCSLETTSKSQTSWSTSSENNREDIVAVDGASKNKTKYRMYSDAYSCSLEIQDFEPSDLNVSYTFSYHFDTYSIRLDLQNTNVELSPSNNTTLISESYIRRTSGDIYNITVWYSKVYPRPQCQVFYLEKNISSSVQTKTTSIGIYFTSIHTVAVLIKHGGNLHMSCRVGGSVYNIKNLTFLIHRMSQDNTGNTCLSSLTTLLVVVITFIVTLILNKICTNAAGFFVLLFWLHKDESLLPMEVISLQHYTEQPKDQPLCPRNQRGIANSGVVLDLIDI